MWMQHLHWGEGRPTPKPVTSSFCSWVPGSRSKRNCSTVEPASKLFIEKFPRSNAEAQSKLDNARQNNMKEGLDARYDVFGDAKKLEKMNDPAYTRAHRIAYLNRLHSLTTTFNNYI